MKCSTIFLEVLDEKQTVSAIFKTKAENFMAIVFRAGNPNFPANQDELKMRLNEIEQLVNKLNANIEFCVAAFKLIEDCDLITEDNVRFLCSAQACKKYDPNFWFIRNRSEGVLRPTKDYNNILTGNDRRFYSGSNIRVEFYEQHFLIVNDWYKDFSIDRSGQEKPSPCPNKRAFYNWLKEKSQDACEKHGTKQKHSKELETIAPDSLDNEFKYSRIDSGIRIDRYRGSAKCVTIPARIDNLPVISIGDSAFSGCWSLIKITILEGVTSIGNKVFYNCENLTEITLPDTVKFIGDSAFSWCTNLESIIILNSVTEMGEGVFSGCTNLQAIKIPASLTSIEAFSFSDCRGLTEITIPDSVEFISGLAFVGCRNLETIYISDFALSREEIERIVHELLRENSYCTISPIPRQK